jgi:shikimate dehydrogenase
MLDLSARTVPTFYFVGVTTGKSSARTVWPDWMGVLETPDVVFEGVDLPLHADPVAYRQVVEHIKQDPLSLGALVTTHKIDLLDASRDMFDELGSYARTLNEVSSISKWDGKLVGDATDPIATRYTLDAMLDVGYFGRCGAHLLCLGAGGAASAISLHFISRPSAADRPQRIVVVDLLQSRLDKLRAMVERQQTDVEFEFVLSPEVSINDQLMESLPDGSMVINATGLGKDRPGSPISDAACFPRNGIAWELNYRGELDFMHQALAQQATRDLRVEDGWIYFLHGWSQVINRVLHMDIVGEQFDRFAAAADAIRG